MGKEGCCSFQWTLWLIKRIGSLLEPGKQAISGNSHTVFLFYSCIFLRTKLYLFVGSRNKGRRRQWQPTPVLLPGKSHGQRSLVGCSPWGHKESDTTKWLHFHFSLSCIGEGNGNPLQCSCLENPRDGGAWWAAIYGVAQSWTWLKWLSSSSRNKRRGEWEWCGSGYKPDPFLC